MLEKLHRKEGMDTHLIGMMTDTGSQVDMRMSIVAVKAVNLR